MAVAAWPETRAAVALAWSLSAVWRQAAYQLSASPSVMRAMVANTSPTSMTPLAA